ncbi:MAG: 4-hydroxy-tetrahydrodipicolinate reductase [Bacteroidales bacterium]|nr:4-hydroxy-tetrahydrodipicolinate reductase [Bacteroidales bacterium]
MKIALLGYGKMGKEVEKIALERHHSIDLIIDINNMQDLNKTNLSKVNVAIDFSTPASAYANIKKCFEAQTPIVSGTTGWMDKYDEIIQQCLENNQSFFYASNFSLGVNLFRVLNKNLARIMNNHAQYNVQMEEIHHTQKLDAPSGTAITLANDMLPLIERKTNWKLNEESSKDILKITATRVPDVPGIHKIIYDSDVDVIEISHTIKSRKGLALGAVMAAEFIANKKGVFSMSDLLQMEI